MKRIVQLVSLAAAAGMIVGCSSTNSETSNNSASNPTPGTAANASADTGSSDMNFSNGGSVNGGPATGNSATGYQLNNPANQAAVSTSSAEGSGFFSRKPDMTIDQLPQAAQTTIRNQIGDQQITSIKQETKDGQTAYRVELNRKSWHAMKPSMLVSADGSIIKESHLEKVNEAAGAQTPQDNVGSQANPSGQVPTVTNSVSGAEEQRNQ